VKFNHVYNHVNYVIGDDGSEKVGRFGGDLVVVGYTDRPTAAVAMIVPRSPR